MKGKFISVEGIDASGKSSQISTVKNILEKHGFEVICTREPGGTSVGEKLRSLVLTDKMLPMTEMLVFAAARAQHVEELIKPALEQGKIVITDRFSDSSFAYQGMARGFKSDVEELERFVLRGFEPDHTLFFDASMKTSAERLLLRNDNNSFDNEIYQFKKLVAEGYKKRYLQNLHRMVHIDANQSLENVTQQVTDWVNNKFIPDQSEDLYNKDKRKVG